MSAMRRRHRPAVREDRRPVAFPPQTVGPCTGRADRSEAISGAEHVDERCSYGGEAFVGQLRDQRSSDIRRTGAAIIDPWA
jgi:hypothetical protein